MIYFSFNNNFINFYWIWINSSEEDDDLMKAVTYLSLIKSINNNKLDTKELSAFMITFFINIEQSTVNKVVSHSIFNDLNLEESEISKLSDFNKMQNEYSQKEIKGKFN